MTKYCKWFSFIPVEPSMVQLNVVQGEDWLSQGSKPGPGSEATWGFLTPFLHLLTTVVPDTSTKNGLKINHTKYIRHIIAKYVQKLFIQYQIKNYFFPETFHFEFLPPFFSTIWSFSFKFAPDFQK
jgi:hypothetical protein